MRISDWSSDVCSSDLIGDRIGDILRLAAARDRLGVGAHVGDDRLRRVLAVVGHLERRSEDIGVDEAGADRVDRSEEHTSELQSLMRISYAVFCLKKKILTTPKIM